MRLVGSKFGIGSILTGTDPRIRSRNLGTGKTYPARVLGNLLPKLPVGVSVLHVRVRLPSFFEAEDLGVRPQPHCEPCTKKLKHCKDCSYHGQVLNVQQREVVKKIESSMILNKQQKFIGLSYPLKESAMLQKDNSSQVLKVQAGIEKGILKEGLHFIQGKERQGSFKFSLKFI